MKLRTQNQRILDYLLETGSGITSGEASEMRPKIMRLSERIRELETDGVIFLRTTEKTKSCHGKYTRYWLKSLEKYHPKSSINHPYADAICDAEMDRL